MSIVLSQASWKNFAEPVMIEVVKNIKLSALRIMTAFILGVFSISLIFNLTGSLPRAPTETKSELGKEPNAFITKTQPTTLDSLQNCSEANSEEWDAFLNRHIDDGYDTIN